MKNDTEVTVYDTESECIAKISYDQKKTAHKHQKLQKSAETTINNYDL